MDQPAPTHETERRNFLQWITYGLLAVVARS